MNKIKEVIESECCDWKPSDTVWELKKEDVDVVVGGIKKLLLEELKKAPHTWEDAIEVIQEL